MVCSTIDVYTLQSNSNHQPSCIDDETLANTPPSTANSKFLGQTMLTDGWGPVVFDQSRDKHRIVQTISNCHGTTLIHCRPVPPTQTALSITRASRSKQKLRHARPSTMWVTQGQWEGRGRGLVLENTTRACLLLNVPLFTPV